MPLAKIHVREGQYDEAGSAGCRAPAQKGSSGPWGFPRRTSSRSFTFCHGVGSLTYSDDLIVLEVTFISGRPLWVTPNEGHGGTFHFSLAVGRSNDA